MICKTIVCNPIPCNGINVFRKIITFQTKNSPNKKNEKEFIVIWKTK